MKIDKDMNSMASITSLSVHTPPITSIEIAIHIFYSYSEIGNAEIKRLFGKLSSATISKLKKAVKNKMIQENVYSLANSKNGYFISTYTVPPFHSISR